MGSSHTRGSSFFLGKVTALGVLCCFALFVCLTLLASFFLPSHLSFKNMYMYIWHLNPNYINDKARQMHTPKAAKEKNKLPSVGFKPVTYCNVGRYSAPIHCE